MKGGDIMKSKDLFMLVGIIVAILAVLGAAAYTLHRFGFFYKLKCKSDKSFIETELEPDM